MTDRVFTVQNCVRQQKLGEWKLPQGCMNAQKNKYFVIIDL
jgi:hypothetical protein